MAIVFDGAFYQVRFNKVSDEPRAVVIFDNWRSEPSFDGPVWGEEFCKAAGFNAIGIKCRSNDWFQHPEIDAALDVVAEFGRTMRLIGFGGSMGGYGLINFAHRISLKSFVAVAPQFSVDPARVPFETRWSSEWPSIIVGRDEVARPERMASGYLAYDPTETLDARHADLILEHHDLVRIPIYFSGHISFGVLQQCGLLERVLIDIFREQFDLPAFMKALRANRHKSSWFWFNLSSRLEGRRHGAAALHAAGMAYRLPNWAPFAIARQYARLLALAGRYDEAVATLEGFANDAAHGAETQSLLFAWRDAKVRAEGPAPVGSTVQA